MIRELWSRIHMHTEVQKHKQMDRAGFGTKSGTIPGRKKEDWVGFRISFKEEVA
jgi:hypothetical protein